jgi:hypothetical protein
MELAISSGSGSFEAMLGIVECVQGFVDFRATLILKGLVSICISKENN